MSKATHKLWMHSTIFAYKMLLLLSYWSATEAFFLFQVRFVFTDLVSWRRTIQIDEIQMPFCYERYGKVTAKQEKVD